MLHSLPTLISKPLIPFGPFYILSPCPLTTVPYSWLSFFASCLLSPLTLSGSFNFQKARWADFASYFDSNCPSAKEYLSLSLSSAAALFTSLALNAAKSSIPFGRIKRHSKAWWSAEMEGAFSERCNAFAAAYRSDEDCQAYISASQRGSSAIAKAEAWQMTCSSLSP